VVASFVVQPHRAVCRADGRNQRFAIRSHRNTFLRSRTGAHFLRFSVRKALPPNVKSVGLDREIHPVPVGGPCACNTGPAGRPNHANSAPALKRNNSALLNVATTVHLDHEHPLTVWGKIGMMGHASLSGRHVNVSAVQMCIRDRYVCAIEEKLGPKPANLSFEEAAAVPIAASTALQGLRDKGRIQPGHKVLVEGASGGVGTFAVQIAKAFGAEVTAVCSPRNVETARSIGADHVIDYTQGDFAHSGLRYDLILAANAHHSIFDYRRALTRDGIYVAAGGGVVRILQALLLGPLLSLIGRKKMGFFLANINQKDLLFLKELLEAGKVAPVIDRRYPLSNAAEALRYLAEGHAQGKVVLTVQPSIGT